MQCIHIGYTADLTFQSGLRRELVWQVPGFIALHTCIATCIYYTTYRRQCIYVYTCRMIKWSNDWTGEQRWECAVRFKSVRMSLTCPLTSKDNWEYTITLVSLDFHFLVALHNTGMCVVMWVVFSKGKYTQTYMYTAKGTMQGLYNVCGWCHRRQKWYISALLKTATNVSFQHIPFTLVTADRTSTMYKLSAHPLHTRHSR